MIHGLQSLPSRRARESGATLVVALIVLVLIMMIGIMAITSSDTQYRLAGNLQYEDVSMNNAEIALQEAERWLATGGNHKNPAFFTANASPYLLAAATDAQRAERNKLPFSMNWSADGHLVTVPKADGGTTSGRYYIELMSVNSRLQGSSQVVGGRGVSACNQVNTYQVTAQGQAPRGATKIVQSYFGVLNC